MKKRITAQRGFSRVTKRRLSRVFQKVKFNFAPLNSENHMRKIYLFVFLSIAITSFGQKPPIKFGDIPMNDLKMTVYEKDSSAAAVVLADYAESKIEYNETKGFQLEFERIRRIKILTKEGLKWADFKIPLYHDGDDDEKTTGLKAVTYNLENGKIVETKVKNESIMKEKFDKNLNFVKVTWPNVKVGSILEISYRVTSDFLFNFQDWDFQSTVPIIWSEYRASIPEYFDYAKYMQGYVPLAIAENSVGYKSITSNSIQRSSGLALTHTINNTKIDYQENRFRWVAKDVPAFKEEPFMTTYRDYISKINFELSYTKFPDTPIKNYMGSWEDINNSYWKIVGDDITGNNSLKKNVEEIISGMSSAEDIISAIYNYVNRNILWDESYQRYPSVSIKKVLEQKKGNSAEINLLLASMLEKAGIKVFPVLISTRDHGFIREGIPVSSQFNNVVCLVKLDQKSILMDATDKTLPMGTIPQNCINGNGFVVSKEGFQWISLKPNTKTKTVIASDLSFTETGSLQGSIKIDRVGYNSVNARKNYLSKGEKDYIMAFANGRPWIISKSEFQNVQEIQLPFKESHDLIINEHITEAGNTIYLSPFIMAKIEENPFKLEKRNYPVDFAHPFDQMYLTKINIPEGYVVDEIPKSKVISLPENAARYTYNATQTGNMISLTSSLVINKSLFSQEEYPNLREFYSQLVAKQAEQIVLKKKQ